LQEALGVLLIDIRCISKNISTHGRAPFPLGSCVI
jgi:hypothetical protein